MDAWSALQNAGLGAIALAVLAGIARALWSLKEKADDKEEKAREAASADHNARLNQLEKMIPALQLRIDEGQKDFGRLESVTAKLADKLDGLQQFWRQEFEKLSDKMTSSMERLRVDVRKDYEEHRQLVHDRMTEATRNMISTVEQVLSTQQQTQNFRRGKGK